MTDQQECIYIREEPIIYYEQKVCREEAVKKVNEMGANLTSQGFKISLLFINCLVDTHKLNT